MTKKKKKQGKVEEGLDGRAACAGGVATATAIPTLGRGSGRNSMPLP
jgi:hypothetical protein